VILPDLEQLWNDWWVLKAVGRAVAAVQYVSCLMYGEHENPVFSPWTPNGGGGPPVLWAFEGHLYDHRWLEPNISFLRKALTPGSVEDLQSLAVERLAGEPEHETAAIVNADFLLCESTVVTRCSLLPDILAKTDRPLQWPDTNATP
jgi:hypothetical protein